MPAALSNLVIKGPALLRGQSIGNINMFTKGDIKVAKKMAMTAVSTDQHGIMDQRLEDVIHEISFTPDGKWTTAETIGAMLQTKAPGSKLINFTSASISAVADGGSGECDLTLSAATTVYEGQYVTISASSVSGYVGTWRVASVTDSTHISVVMTYSAGATGTLKVPPCLIIHPLQNWSGAEAIQIYQFTGISKYPDLILNGKDTCLGEMTLTALYNPYRSAEDVDSLVRYHTWAAPASSVLDDFDVTGIYTGPPLVTFAASGDTAAPWGAGFGTLDGVRVTFGMELDADKTDIAGTGNYTVGAVTAVATLTPVGEDMTDEVIQKKLMQMEHSSTNGVRRGGRLGTSADLVFMAAWTNPADGLPYYIRFPRAVIGDAAASFGSSVPRNGALTFTAVRTLSSGALASLFEITYD